MTNGDGVWSLEAECQDEKKKEDSMFGVAFLSRCYWMFGAFRGGRQMPEKLIYLGKILPSAIMAVLIVYCLKDAIRDVRGVGIAQFVAVIVVAVSYKWKHNTLVSIALGTVCNMLLGSCYLVH